MKPLPLLLAVLLFGIGTSCTDRTDRHQKALEELDRIIERRDAYGRTKNLRIAARRDELAAAKDPRKRIALAEEIYKEYYNYDIDSAYHYARRMLALAQSYGDGTRINCARVYLAKTVLNGGMYGEAFRILHQVDTTRLAPANKSEYYNVYRSYLSKQLSGADPALKARYRDSLQFYNVLRIRNLPEGSVPRKELEAMMYCKAGEARKALDLLLPEYEAGIEDTKASFVEDIMKNGAQLGNRELIETFVNEDTDMFEWMLEHGLADNEFSLDKATGGKAVFAPEYHCTRSPGAARQHPRRFLMPHYLTLSSQCAILHSILDKKAEESELSTWSLIPYPPAS